MRINEAGNSIAQRVQGRGGASASGQPANVSDTVGAEPSAQTRTDHLVPTMPPTHANRHEAAQPVRPAHPFHLGPVLCTRRPHRRRLRQLHPHRRGIFTDGAMLVALAIMAIILAIIGTRKIRLKKRATNRIMRTCIALETLCVLLIPLIHLAGSSRRTCTTGFALPSRSSVRSPSSTAAPRSRMRQHHRCAVRVQRPCHQAKWRSTSAR